ncbi:MAG: T9SS type A sorting domain-containing protein, partial [Bacteroidales bacterium]|nr:T9SS type A sorting domain-containing protein [Bacteroidales bacterium]
HGTLATSGRDDIRPLSAGTSIGTHGNWEAQGDAYLVNYLDETLFQSNADSYIGFRIKINGNTHYGWAKVHVSGTVATGLQVQWLQCAYENTPNTPIAAGNTGTGIRDNELPQVAAYPNPVVNEVTIMTSVEDAATVTVCDMNGRLVNAPVMVSDDQIRVNMTDCPAGIYFVRFNHNAVKVVKK